MATESSALEREISEGEGKRLEFKGKVPDSSLKYLKTVVAFANENGGKIIFGINDITHKIEGIDEPNIFATADSISNAIYDSIEPKVVADVTIQSAKGKTLELIPK